MKSILVIFCVLVVAVGSQEYSTSSEVSLEQSAEPQKKTNAWETDRVFDKNEILCILYDKKCDKRMYEVRGTMMKAFKDGCVGCGQEDKEAAGRAMAIMLYKQPIVWKMFVDSYGNFKKH